MKNVLKRIYTYTGFLMSQNFRFNKHWKEFTQKELDIIEEERQKRLEKLKKLNLGKLCPACEKPNSVAVDFCTGCKFTPLKTGDIIELPKNVFLDILEGRNTGTPILYRDEEVCLFDDKFGVSDNHLDVIPVVVIPDIKDLTKEHIPLLEKLYEAGIKEFEKRDIKHIKKEDFEKYMVAGYNFPVSVKHLHVHMVLPPYTHKKVFQYPRWHSHKKIIEDLKKYGKVRTYDEFPDDEAGKAEYDRAMKFDDLVKKEKKVEE